MGEEEKKTIDENGNEIKEKVTKISSKDGPIDPSKLEPGLNYDPKSRAFWGKAVNYHYERQLDSKEKKTVEYTISVIVLLIACALIVIFGINLFSRILLSFWIICFILCL